MSSRRTVGHARPGKRSTEAVTHGDSLDLLSMVALSPAPLYGREGSLEILDYGDEDWLLEAADVLPSSSAAAHLRRSSLTTSGRAKILQGGANGMLEILDPEPYVLQEYEIDSDEQDSGLSYSLIDAAEDLNSSRDLGNSRVTAASRAGLHQQPALANEGNSATRVGTVSRPRALDQSKAKGYQYDDQGVTVTSDEENDIVKQIRHEITEQLKQDMKDELAIYHHKGQQSAGGAEDLSNSEEMPQELKDAIVTMRKYDRILRRKVEREKEVKHQRIQLQKRLRDELAEIDKEAQISGRGRERHDIRLNADRFLSLAAPPPSGIYDGDSDDDSERDAAGVGSVTPVFATQPPDASSAGSKVREGKGAGSSQRSHDESSWQGSDSATGSNSERAHAKSKRATAAGTSGQRPGNPENGKKGGKDFVKRNIELAADAGNIIAMTDDEKRRLEELLSDIDLVPDEPPSTPRRSAVGEEEDASTGQGRSGVPSVSPASVSAASTGGYSYDGQAADRMAVIDRRLQELMAPETWRAITAVPYNDGSGVDGGGGGSTASGGRLSKESLMLFTKTHWGLERDLDAIGEPALKDTHEEREAKLRLQQIEYRLAELSSAPALDVEMEAPRLSAEQLQSLLEQCVRAMSMASHNAIPPSETGQITYPASMAAPDIHDRTAKAEEDISSVSGQSSLYDQSSMALPDGRASTVAMTADDGSSSWSLILDHPPPPLPRDTLQYLLEQARREGVGRPPSTETANPLEAEASSDDDTLGGSDDGLLDSHGIFPNSSRAPSAEARQSSGRLTARQREETAGFDLDLRSPSSHGSGRTTERHQRLPPLRMSSESPFLVQRYT